jgi:nitrate/TMAO reductase-like tetraheme cytochrome c subunit
MPRAIVGGGCGKPLSGWGGPAERREVLMKFAGVFVAVVLGSALVGAALIINSYRPPVATQQPSAAFVRATGKCAECHSRTQYSVVHEYELSAHAKKGVSCLDCHSAVQGQKGEDHFGFVINPSVTAANCRSCHESIYQEFLRSRHAAPSWAAVRGPGDFTAEQVAFSEKYQPGGVNRPANPLTKLEGSAAVVSGCASCHSVGKPNADGTIGTCTACHSRHTSSVELARLPSTCGQCHLGPDHSQLEIYTESKHGVMFAAQHEQLNLKASPDTLTTRDMFVPTCATCHMSGINGLAVTHDPSERLSYYLFAEITQKRPNFARAQASMRAVCLNCHTRPIIDRVYTQADAVVESTNEKVAAAKAIMDSLRADGVLGGPSFSNPIEFDYFDLWHYYGRTAKHAAFMGGADFVQWHGNYPILRHMVEIQKEAKQLRSEHGSGTK